MLKKSFPHGIALAAFATFAISGALAQQPPAPVQRVVESLLQRESASLPGNAVITVTPLDAANQLPPCAALDAFLPAGTRAWGQISVGVRCSAPVNWTVYVTARVAVMTQYLVIAQPISAGQIIGPNDIASTHGDLAMQPAGTMTDAAQAVGQRARYAVASGQTLRADMLRLPHAVRQGSNVKIVGIGSGFQVTNEGRALNNAAEGEEVRVKLRTGQVVTGTARGGGIVEISF